MCIYCLLVGVQAAQESGDRSFEGIAARRAGIVPSAASLPAAAVGAPSVAYKRPYLITTPEREAPCGAGCHS